MDDFAQISRYCNKELALLYEYLVSGKATSMEEYKLICGKIYSHRMVLEEIDKLSKKEEE